MSAALRRKLEDALRAEIEAERDEPPIEEVRARILERIDRIDAHHREGRLAAGYRKPPDDYPDGRGLSLVAPGWALVRQGGG